METFVNSPLYFLFGIALALCAGPVADFLHDWIMDIVNGLKHQAFLKTSEGKAWLDAEAEKERKWQEYLKSEECKKNLEAWTEYRRTHIGHNG